MFVSVLSYMVSPVSWIVQTVYVQRIKKQRRLYESQAKTA